VVLPAFIQEANQPLIPVFQKLIAVFGDFTFMTIFSSNPSSSPSNYFNLHLRIMPACCWGHLVPSVPLNQMLSRKNGKRTPQGATEKTAKNSFCASFRSFLCLNLFSFVSQSISPIPLKLMM